MSGNIAVTRNIRTRLDIEGEKELTALSFGLTQLILLKTSKNSSKTSFYCTTEHKYCKNKA